ncbi:hypothetical protein PIB30_063539 [Stylosanthes scabra]|uniref:Wall-associated receptor kinase galacturonan-binding domain-containing protein n=1 Tax=Stylosanthes scabra TaxID=79078 RepID=A0ABU6SM91_9FABA|nr:hypothetical protein [Stylosanthes scabra]
MLLKETIIVLAVALLLYKVGPVLYFLLTSPEPSLYTDSCGLIFDTRADRTCNDPSYHFLCHHNQTLLYLNYGRHFINAITTNPNNNATFQSFVGGLDANNCPALTVSTLTYANFTEHRSEHVAKLDKIPDYGRVGYYSDGIIVVSCDTSIPYEEVSRRCASGGATDSKSKARYSYVLPFLARVNDVGESCSVDMIVRVLPWGPVPSCNKSCSYNYDEEIEVGEIRVKWRPNRCGEWEGAGDGDATCFLDAATNMVFCHSGAGFFKGFNF